jgi:hypothetical protein
MSLLILKILFIMTKVKTINWIMKLKIKIKLTLIKKIKK